MLVTAGTKLKWKECWRTGADEHSNDAVQAMAYAPLLDGLPGGDGHGGWLVSASKNLLNLWECNAGRGEATLQVGNIFRSTGIQHAT